MHKKDSRGDKKPPKAPKRYVPALETILRTGDASAVPKELAARLERIMALAKERGIEKEVGELLAAWASKEGLGAAFVNRVKELSQDEQIPEGLPRKRPCRS